MKPLFHAAIPALARQCSNKLARVQWNARRPGPHPPVRFTAAEVNAWLASRLGQRHLPHAVSQIQLACQPGWIHGKAVVDFSQLPHTAHTSVETLATLLLAGPHKIEASAQVVSAQAPAAQLRLTQVGMDGRRVPGWLLQLILREYVLPKHPEWGQTLRISLPRGVRRAVVGSQWVRLEYS